MDAPRFQQCPFASPEHRGIQALRERVLLAPTGRTVDDFEAAHPGFELRSTHFAAIDSSGDVIACVSIRPNHPQAGEGSLFQMAVDPAQQSRGLGRALAEHATAWSRDTAGLARLSCSARTTAKMFYERLGWEPVGDLYESAGLPHIRMTLALRPA